jgi:hypothetical protein
MPFTLRVVPSPEQVLTELLVKKESPLMLDVTRAPFAFVILAVPRVKYCRVEAGPNCSR